MAAACEAGDIPVEPAIAARDVIARIGQSGEDGRAAEHGG